MWRQLLTCPQESCSYSGMLFHGRGLIASFHRTTPVGCQPTRYSLCHKLDSNKEDLAADVAERRYKSRHNIINRATQYSLYRKFAGSEGDSGTNVTERPYSPTSSSGRIGEPPIVISGVCTASTSKIYPSRTDRISVVPRQVWQDTLPRMHTERQSDSQARHGSI